MNLSPVTLGLQRAHAALVTNHPSADAIEEARRGIAVAMLGLEALATVEAEPRSPEFGTGYQIMDDEAVELHEALESVDLDPDAFRSALEGWDLPHSGPND